ncbi:MAG: (2Fe-2S)-binding protein [Bdellovibrionales bacterium]|nr:(2Fe-2S)-binding protein [Bdellovibrionales bacterium]
MYICICKGINEKEIEELIRKGRKNVEEISNACGAGSECGSCLRRLERKIEDGCFENSTALPLKEPKKD